MSHLSSNKCPNCDTQLLSEKDTGTGNEIRQYWCPNCQWSKIENHGTALWKVLSDGREEDRRNKEQENGRRMEAWACEFSCEMPLSALLALVNDRGPWTWELRDCHPYGDYLACQTREGVRIRILDGREFFGGGPAKYFAQLEAQGGAAQGSSLPIGALRDLLGKAGAQGVSEIRASF